MPTFEAGDVVRVPFPYTDRATLQRRPALVISRQRLGETVPLFWAMMITSADNRGWPEDIRIGEPFDVTGLPIPSIIRVAKISTIESAMAEKVGRLLPDTFAEVGEALRRITTQARNQSC